MLPYNVISQQYVDQLQNKPEYFRRYRLNFTFHPFGSMNGYWQAWDGRSSVVFNDVQGKTKYLHLDPLTCPNSCLFSKVDNPLFSYLFMVALYGSHYYGNAKGNEDDVDVLIVPIILENGDTGEYRWKENCLEFVSNAFGNESAEKCYQNQFETPIEFSRKVGNTHFCFTSDPAWAMLTRNMGVGIPHKSQVKNCKMLWRDLENATNRALDIIDRKSEYWKCLTGGIFDDQR